jgi:glycosyltransferase involved in cell wall biosynthesis
MNPVVRGLSLALVGMNVPIVLGTYVGDWKRLRIKPTYRPRNVKERFAHSFKLVLDALQQSQADVLALATPYAASRVPLSALRRNQIQFLHHGVDASLFSRAPQAGDPVPRPLSILCLGSVRYHKGTTTLIDAFRGVVAEIPQARLIFVGSGLMDEMKGRLRSYGLEDRAEFVGDSSRSEVAGWLRACSVLCAPSFGEPYGQNVLEAMATGKPIVATSEGGHPYLLDPSGGFRVQPGDTKALANALLAILRDPLQADRMGAYNRVIAEQRHDWAHVAGELEQLYRSAMSQRQRRARSFAAFRLKARA